MLPKAILWTLKFSVKTKAIKRSEVKSEFPETRVRVRHRSSRHILELRHREAPPRSCDRLFSVYSSSQHRGHVRVTDTPAGLRPSADRPRPPVNSPLPGSNCLFFRLRAAVLHITQDRCYQSSAHITMLMKTARKLKSTTRQHARRYRRLTRTADVRARMRWPKKQRAGRADLERHQAAHRLTRNAPADKTPSGGDGEDSLAKATAGTEEAPDPEDTFVL